MVPSDERMGSPNLSVIDQDKWLGRNYPYQQFGRSEAYENDDNKKVEVPDGVFQFSAQKLGWQMALVAGRRGVPNE